MLQLEKGFHEILAGRFALRVDNLENYKEVVTFLAKEEDFEQVFTVNNTVFLVKPFVSDVDGSVDLLIREEKYDAPSDTAFKLVSVGSKNVLYIIQELYADKVGEIANIVAELDRSVLEPVWKKMREVSQL